MAIPKENYFILNKELSDMADKDGIERKTVKLVIKKNNSLLLLKRAKSVNFPNLYEFPGGGIEKDEDIFTAGKRELYEETGLSVRDFISQIRSVDFTVGSDNKKCRQYFFFVLSDEKKIVLNPIEHYDYKWVSVGEVDKLFIFPETRSIIKQALLDYEG